MAVNSFRPRKFDDFEIVDGENKVVGHIRVKPSGVLWADKNGKVWHGLSLNQFVTFAKEHGKTQTK